jgi:hypothetical protein
MWRVSKNGNSALQACHFGKYLLTVGGDEQQEMAISVTVADHFTTLLVYDDKLCNRLDTTV